MYGAGAPFIRPIKKKQLVSTIFLMFYYLKILLTSFRYSEFERMRKHTSLPETIQRPLIKEMNPIKCILNYIIFEFRSISIL